MSMSFLGILPFLWDGEAQTSVDSNKSSDLLCRLCALFCWNKLRRMEPWFNSHKGCRMTQIRMGLAHLGGGVLGRNWATMYMGECSPIFKNRESNFVLFVKRQHYHPYGISSNYPPQALPGGPTFPSTEQSSLRKKVGKDSPKRGEPPFGISPLGQFFCT